MKEKVDKVDPKVDQVNDQVGSLDSKLDLVVKSVSKIKYATPSLQDQQQHFDYLNSLRLKHKVEEFEKHYDEKLYNQIDTIERMLKNHDDITSTTNELVNQTHVCHEKKIKDQKGRQGNLNLQQVPIKVNRSTQDFVHIPNYKFDEVSFFFEEHLDVIKNQALTDEAYENHIKISTSSFKNCSTILGN